MKKAVIYARYSCDNQTEQSIEGQLRVCTNYAKANDIVIVDTYIDRAMTGTNDNRPSFQQMLRDSNEKQWQYILVYKLDRFSRNKYEAIIHKKKLKDNGVKVLSAMENIPDSPEGIILESLLEGMNQYYSAELSQKVKRGMFETRQKGFWQGGHLILGYKLEERKLVIDNEQADIVKYIFEQYAGGYSINEILNMLDNKQFRFKGKPLNYNKLLTILKNEKYLGVYYHEDERIDNMYPQIISDEIFQKVKSLLPIGKKGKNSSTNKFYLRHKLICGYCGHYITSESGTTKNGTVKHYYKCGGRKKHGLDCQKTTIRKDYLENLICNILINELSQQDNLDFIISKLMLFQQKRASNNTYLTTLQKELTQVNTELENIARALAQGVFSKTTTNLLNELETRQENLLALIEQEKLKNQTFITEKDLRSFFKEGLKKEPFQLINYFIKKIILFNDEIKIEFYNPIKKSPDDSQDFCFYEGTTTLPIPHRNGRGFSNIYSKYMCFI